MINKNSKIFLAGHKGLVGSAILRKLKFLDYKKIILANKSDLNLLSQSKVEKFVKKKRPDLVIIAAAKVGGILANSNSQADFIYDNLMIQSNLINSSFKNNVKNNLKHLCPFLKKHKTDNLLLGQYGKRPIKKIYELPYGQTF